MTSLCDAQWEAVTPVSCPEDGSCSHFLLISKRWILSLLLSSLFTFTLVTSITKPNITILPLLLIVCLLPLKNSVSDIVSRMMSSKAAPCSWKKYWCTFSLLLPSSLTLNSLCHKVLIAQASSLPWICQLSLHFQVFLQNIPKVMPFWSTRTTSTSIQLLITLCFYS